MIRLKTSGPLIDTAADPTFDIDQDRKRRFRIALDAYAAECWEFGKEGGRKLAFGRGDARNPSENRQTLFSVLREMEAEIHGLRARVGDG